MDPKRTHPKGRRVHGAAARLAAHLLLECGLTLCPSARRASKLDLWRYRGRLHTSSNKHSSTASCRRWGGAETAPLSAEESGGAGMREGKEQERKRCGGRGGHLSLFEEPRSSVLGHHGRTGTDLDLGAKLAGGSSSDKKQGPMSGMSAHPEVRRLKLTVCETLS